MEESNVPAVQLNDGAEHPMIGFGTYKVGFIPASSSGAEGGEEAAGAQEGPSARACVLDALKCGYRFLDCAEFYGNESEVGAAIEESQLPRGELFLASKVWTSTIYAGGAAVRAQVERTLTALRTPYLDLYCVHWPVPGKHVEAYLALEELKKEGAIRSLGLSNYTVEDYQELMERATVRPAVNQIEVNPFLHRRVTLAFFQGEGVVVQSYRALRNGKAFEDATVCAVARKHRRTPAQILGRWCVQRGCVYIPKSVRRARMEENRAVFDFELEGEDMAALDALTTPENIAQFVSLYRKCVVRDTPLGGTLEGVKMDITEG